MSNPRQRLLETAARLFVKRGYECVGINEIITKAEVAKASFYHHFPSKQALCAAWLREEAARSRHKQQELLDSKRSLPKKIAAQFDALGCWVEGTCFRACPFSITAAMPDAGEESREVIREYKDSCRDFWQQLARQADITPARARELGDTWFLLYSGAATESQNSNSIWPVEQARKTALALARQAAA